MITFIAWILGIMLGALVMARINLGKLLGDLEADVRGWDAGYAEGKKFSGAMTVYVNSLNEHGAILARNDEANEIMVSYKADMARYRRVEDEA
jgi:hypothetical protein